MRESTAATQERPTTWPEGRTGGFRRTAKLVVAFALAASLPTVMTAGPASAAVSPTTQVLTVSTTSGFAGPGVISPRTSVVVLADGRYYAADGNSSYLQGRIPGTSMSALLKSMASSVDVPASRWGNPRIADAETTTLAINYGSAKLTANVYALSVDYGRTARELAAVNKVRSTLAKISSAARASGRYRPTVWEARRTVEPMMSIPESGLVGLGVGLANPASVFCQQLGGTLVPDEATQGAFSWCDRPGQPRMEEWELYRLLKAELPVWPRAQAPEMACVAVKATELAKQPNKVKGPWVTRSGEILDLDWRAVLPGAKPCS